MKVLRSQKWFCPEGVPIHSQDRCHSGYATTARPSHKPRRAYRVETTLRQACPPATGGAMCVQRFDDSQCSAIHTTFRASLRSSSMQEPRDPLLKVLLMSLHSDVQSISINATPGAEASTPVHGFKKVLGPAGHSVMIPPQVHLRRPCYDFYFL